MNKMEKMTVAVKVTAALKRALCELMLLSRS